MAHFPFNVDEFGSQATARPPGHGIGVEWRHFYPHLSVRLYPPGQMYNEQPPTPVSRTLTSKTKMLYRLYRPTRSASDVDLHVHVYICTCTYMGLHACLHVQSYFL